MKNTGKPFEEIVKQTALAYERIGILSLRKIDPPLRVLRQGNQIRVIQLASPWLDYGGTWTERGGRALFVEAKSSQQMRMPLDQESGGIKQSQIYGMKHWNMNGAAVCCLWEFSGRTVFISLRQIKAKLAERVKHLKFEDLPLVNQGTGFVLIDFAKHLREEYPQ